MPTAKIGDIELHYVDQGKGRPLLLVHGFPLDHSMWSAQIAELARHSRVIAPDLRGFGQSGVTSGTVTMQQYADDLAVFLDSLAILEKVVFGGLSMGGYIAWQFWERHPNRLAALVLCDTKAVADDAEAARGRLKTAEQVTSQGPSGLVENMLPRLFCETTLRENPAFVSETRQIMLNSSPVGIAAALRGMAARPDMTGKLSGIRVPTLVVCGESDVISPPKEMRTIASSIPNSRFCEVPRAGHLSPLEQSAIVNGELQAFLATVGN